MIIQSRKPEAETVQQFTLERIEKMSGDILRFGNPFGISFDQGAQRIVGMLKTLRMLGHIHDYHLGIRSSTSLNVGIYSSCGTHIGSFRIEFD